MIILFSIELLIIILQLIIIRLVLMLLHIIGVSNPILIVHMRLKVEFNIYLDLLAVLILHKILMIMKNGTLLKQVELIACLMLVFKNMLHLMVLDHIIQLSSVMMMKLNSTLQMLFEKEDMCRSVEGLLKLFISYIYSNRSITI